ncbi:MAG: cytidylate kinase family protein [Dethiobacter sp.]|nr:cytidylate kinase family protein [Dethiobacter sp.]
MTVITISRQFGAGGEMVARILAQELGYLLVNREIVAEGLAGLGLPPQLTRFDKKVKNSEEQEKKRRFYLTALHDYIMDLAKGQPIVLLGRGGQFLFYNQPGAFHIRVQAPLQQRIQWVQEIFHLDPKGASRLVQERDRSKKRYVREVFNRSWIDIEYFDLVLNTGSLTVQGAAQIALQAVSLHDSFAVKEKPKSDAVAEEATGTGARFMHPSEAELAHVLDFYNISWQYEPHTFALQRDEDGKVTEALTPDFFLPDFNLYLELTTQRQKLVWKKNKKVRRLKELYPDINIKIIYGRDYRSLLKKFGLD